MFHAYSVNHTKPVRTTAKLHAFNQLQQWIIDGTLQPDEKLNDIELAQALGVSRTPIRESLQLLESQGFVYHATRESDSSHTRRKRGY